ncbi:hypothetical protein KQX54_019165 [Cotesia glomerata]|uniref:Uncharacterized protein n=1 Tax=Cotesia glomerata TaxID=32391 RepID=A0AAV7I641_COTGL|nr:hypothetical protein KQX54_019165 [Cotesia glomerata]
MKKPVIHDTKPERKNTKQEGENLMADPTAGTLSGSQTKWLIVFLYSFVSSDMVNPRFVLQVRYDKHKNLFLSSLSSPRRLPTDETHHYENDTVRYLYLCKGDRDRRPWGQL